tara:strand:+ start:178 stop:528 length:351 start_codon:yes stop_codon:yes gene_type:complete
MAKKNFNYSDLSPKELELLKDMYIDLKVKSMNNDDLKDFAIENISLQIKSTIGNDEELEAWQEMEEFFKDEFNNIIRDLQIKMKSKNIEQTNLDTEEIKLETENDVEDKKLDMWED